METQGQQRRRQWRRCESSAQSFDGLETRRSSGLGDHYNDDDGDESCEPSTPCVGDIDAATATAKIALALALALATALSATPFIAHPLRWIAFGPIQLHTALALFIVFVFHLVHVYSIAAHALDVRRFTAVVPVCATRRRSAVAAAAVTID